MVIVCKPVNLLEMKKNEHNAQVKNILPSFRTLLDKVLPPSTRGKNSPTSSSRYTPLHGALEQADGLSIKNQSTRFSDFHTEHLKLKTQHLKLSPTEALA